MQDEDSPIMKENEHIYGTLTEESHRKGTIKAGSFPPAIVPFASAARMRTIAVGFFVAATTIPTIASTF